MSSETPTSPISSVQNTASDAVIAPAIEQTLSRLSAYRNVRGVMILSRRAGSEAHGSGASAGLAGAEVKTSASGVAGILSSTGSVFEGESGTRYAKAVEGIVVAATIGLAECDAGDELKLLRIRTKRHELIITPDPKFLLVVLQDPSP